MRLDNLKVLCELSELCCVEGAEQSVELRSFLVFDALFLPSPHRAHHEQLHGHDEQ